MTANKFSTNISFNLLVLLFVFSSSLFSQTTTVIKHNQLSGDNASGRFTITQTGQSNINSSAKVKEISISVSGSKEKDIVFSADLTEESISKPSKDISVTIKSYANTGYAKEAKILEEEIIMDSDSEADESENGEESVSRKPTEQVAEDAGDGYEQVRMYLELNVDGETSSYDFYDKGDLEGIISGINSKYGTNYEAVGSDRSLSINKLPDEKVETSRSVSKRLKLTKKQIEAGETAKIAGFDIVQFEAELLKDKITSKENIKSYTLLIETGDLYINGNRIDVKLSAKYRKILDNFSFKYDDE